MINIKKIWIITIAAIIYSLGIGGFLNPNNLAPGGVTGISVMLHSVLGIPIGISIFALNIPILWIGYRKLGRKLIYISVYSLAIASVFTDIMSSYGFCITTDPLLASLFGGALIGCGIGIIFRNGGTTGGTDIVVRLLKLRYRHIQTGVIFLLADIVVVGMSALVFRNADVALYAGISVMATSMIMNRILYGSDEAKLIYIISDRNDIIIQTLLRVLGVGATCLKGSGAYTKKDKDIIMCVMRRQQLPQAEEIVNKIDENSFMIVTSATEIFGEGYKKHGKIY